MKKINFIIIYKIACVSFILTFFLHLTQYVHTIYAVEKFQVLVDTNQIYPAEAEQAIKFAADGVWTIPQNSKGVNWSKTLNDLNANKWIVSEDNPNSTSQVDLVSKTIGRMVDGAMFYSENGINQVISDAKIEQYASHIVPGFGPIGNRIIVLTRSYENITRQKQLNLALKNPHVAGAAFEFNPGTISSKYRFAAGCKYILDLGKKCYLLMPPNRPETNYLHNIILSIKYFADAHLLNNQNVYVVLPVYVRRNTINVNFLSTSLNDPNSIESVVKWLNKYRNLPPTSLAGDLNSDGKVDILDYNIFKSNFGRTGTDGFIPSDIFKNGKVDIFDYNILVENFGK